uniref:Uncharacterized protein n=1 Tax=Cacopsylla melanoneura TaxID=428564 RepID=A0A8D8T7W9_9HEMI
MWSIPSLMLEHIFHRIPRRGVHHAPLAGLVGGHNVLPVTHGQLTLTLARVVWRAGALLSASATAVCTRSVWLFPSVVHHPLCILEHFLSPEVEEVVWIRVELQTELAILSILV